MQISTREEDYIVDTMVLSKQDSEDEDNDDEDYDQKVKDNDD
jgi:hypothetical protein